MPFEALNRDGHRMAQAGFGKRLMAFIIDLIIFYVLNGILNLVVFIPLLNIKTGRSRALWTVETVTSGDLILPGLALLLYALYHWYFWVLRNGITPGKSAMDIQIVKVDGSRFTNADFVRRFAGYFISSAPAYLGFIWVMFDRHDQTWHDKIARTVVIRTVKKNKYVTPQPKTHPHHLEKDTQ